jgi:hypothetical protein
MINNANNDKIIHTLDVLSFIENEDYTERLTELVHFTIHTIDHSNMIQFSHPLDTDRKYIVFIQIDRNNEELGIRLSTLAKKVLNGKRTSVDNIPIQVPNTKKDEYLVLTDEREEDIASYYVYVFRHMAKQLKKQLYKEKLTIDIQTMS